VLLCAQDHTPPQIAQLVRCSPDTVRRVLRRYLSAITEFPTCRGLTIT